MPRLLAVGHVTWDLRSGPRHSREDATHAVLGGSVTYAAHAATRLGWEAGVLTTAGPDFDPGRDLPCASVFLGTSPCTTRFQNTYREDGTRGQALLARAADVDVAPLSDEWRQPDVLLLGPVAGEIAGCWAPLFDSHVVGALAQGWLRQVDAQGRVRPREWVEARASLPGVHILFLSEQDLPDALAAAHAFLALVPIVALTRGWRGLTLLTRDGVQEIASLPRAEADATGAGDVFAASFLIRYHETGDPAEAAAFGACAASCAVEGPGV